MPALSMRRGDETRHARAAAQLRTAPPRALHPRAANRLRSARRCSTAGTPCRRWTTLRCVDVRFFVVEGARTAAACAVCVGCMRHSLLARCRCAAASMCVIALRAHTDSVLRGLCRGHTHTHQHTHTHARTHARTHTHAPCRTRATSTWCRSCAAAATCRTSWRCVRAACVSRVCVDLLASAAACATKPQRVNTPLWLR
jgi:hypothetical protein